MTLGIGPTPEVATYWEAALADSGKTKGPIHRVVKIVTECNAHGSPTQWTVPRHGVLSLLSDEDAADVFRDMAVQAVWKDLAKDRQGYHGLEQGIDYYYMVPSGVIHFSRAHAGGGNSNSKNQRREVI